MQRPNILLITADQISAKQLGCYGDVTGATPNLDSLAARGLRFENAYTPSPICIPARASMVTGQYPHTHGKLAHVRMPMEPRPPMLAEILSANGYQTGLVGKTHFHPPDDPLGFQKAQFTIDTVLGYELGLKDGYLQFLQQQGVLDEMGITDFSKETFRAYRTRIASLPEKIHRASWVGEQSCQQLRAFAKGAQPFFMHCSFVEPHGPEDCPPKFAEKFKGKTPTPVTRENELDDKPAVQRTFAENYWKMMQRGYPNIDPEQMRCRFYGLVNLVDKNIGKVMRALDECNLTDSTVVMFLTDHGESLGDHGMWGKAFFYDSCANVPWICAGPNMPSGRSSGALVSLVDLLPTILGLAGISSDALQLDGASLWPQLKDPAALGRSAVFSELCQGQCLPPGTLCNCKMVRSEQWKYVYYSDGPEEELYDLANDRDELYNLASDQTQQHQIRHMRDLLLKWLVETEVNRLHPTADSHYPMPRYCP